MRNTELKMARVKLRILELEAAALKDAKKRKGERNGDDYANYLQQTQSLIGPKLFKRKEKFLKVAKNQQEIPN